MASGPVPQAQREPLRRSRNAPPATPPPRRRKRLHLLLIFVTLVLLLDALVGEKGLLETIRARRQYRELTASVERIRSENARLREEARRLLEDPSAIESLAREELGLIRPGEMLFIVKDAKPSH